MENSNKIMEQPKNLGVEVADANLEKSQKFYEVKNEVEKLLEQDNSLKTDANLISDNFEIQDLKNEKNDLKNKNQNLSEKQNLSESLENENLPKTEIDENVKSATDEKFEGSIGKFKDIESLNSAYNELQVAFTRKCQELADLKKNQKVSANFEINFENDDGVLNYVKNNSKLKNQILEGYFEDLQKNSSPIVISKSLGNGIPVNAPSKPKTLDEARDVVKKMFN